ncbi:MAG: hypothetical protein WAW61_16230 [Methylococcaceae bacterium]
MPAKHIADSISQDSLSGLRIGLTSGYDHFLQLKTFLDAMGASTVFIIDRNNVPRSDDELLQIVDSWNQEFDIIIIPLTLPYYGSLRIAEVIHLTNAKVRIVLLSQSKQLNRKLAVPLFDEYLSHDDLGNLAYPKSRNTANKYK